MLFIPQFVLILQVDIVLTFSSSLFPMKVGDGEGGGGISLARLAWDKEALAIAKEVALSFNGELQIYAFRTLLNSTIRVRIERLTNK